MGGCSASACHEQIKPQQVRTCMRSTNVDQSKFLLLLLLLFFSSFHTNILIWILHVASFSYLRFTWWIRTVEGVIPGTVLTSITNTWRKWNWQWCKINYSLCYKWESERAMKIIHLQCPRWQMHQFLKIPPVAECLQ